VSIRRLSADEVGIHGSTAGHSLGTWEPDSGELVELEREIDIVANTTTAELVVPIGGALELGQEVTGQTAAPYRLLRSGDLRLITRAYFKRSNTPLLTTSLTIGDRVVVPALSDERSGFVAASKSGLRAVFRARAKEVTIFRVGAFPETLVPSWADRLRTDPVLQGVWGAALFVLVLPKKLRDWQ
jgi:hypothetical protein